MYVWEFSSEMVADSEGSICARKLEQTVKGGPGNLSREISVIEINK